MADVASTLAAWSSTTASNTPAGTTAIGNSLDDNLREIQGVVVRGLSHKGSDIASAATTDLGAVEGIFHDVTGSTTITSFGTVRAGILKFLKFEGALTLTHNASIILPGGVSITTANLDTACFISEGSGVWRCLSYERVVAGSFTAECTGPCAAQNISITYYRNGRIICLNVEALVVVAGNNAAAAISVDMTNMPAAIRPAIQISECKLLVTDNGVDQADPGAFILPTSGAASVFLDGADSTFTATLNALGFDAFGVTYLGAA
jgi:hypothetical protein